MLNARQIQQLRREPAEPNRLKAAMRLANKTQNDVSVGTGLAQAHVSKIATRGQRVTLETTAKLAAYFGCQIADLFPRETAVEVRHAS